MKTLTKREKVLLYTLCVVALVAGLQFLVLEPAQTRGDALDNALLERDTARSNMEVLVAQSGTLQKQIDELNAGIEQEKESYMPVMTNDDLDKYITGMLQSHGLVAQSMVISASEEQQATPKAVLTLVDVKVSGGMEQFKSLLETVRKTEGLRITGFALNLETTPVPTATVTPKAAKKNRRATPTPLPTPTPTPYVTQYTMTVSFAVMEYDETREGAYFGLTESAAPEATPAEDAPTLD